MFAHRAEIAGWVATKEDIIISPTLFEFAQWL
jgi:hypothetical protein